MISNFKITSVGEILLDIYEDKKIIGGAPFNFIYHIHKFLGTSIFVSALGDDKEGRKIEKFLTEQNISKDFIDAIQSKATGRVIVKLNKDGIPNYEIERNVAYDFIHLTPQKKQKLIQISNLIYFGTLCQRSPVSRTTIQSLYNQNMLYFCDLNLRQNFYSNEIIEASLRSCNILKVNEEELKLVIKLFLGEELNLKRGVEKLQSKYEITYIAVTQGEKGASLFSKVKSSRIEPLKIKVVDTLGAGDAYSAILALGILNNIELNKINSLAVEFSSDICKVNGALPYNNEIYDKYREELLNE